MSSLWTGGEVMIELLLETMVNVSLIILLWVLILTIKDIIKYG